MNPEARDGARVTFWGCILTAFVEVSFAILDTQTLGAWPNSWLDVIHAAVALLGAAWLWRRREQASLAECAVVFAPVALLYLPTIWVEETTALALGVRRNLLGGHEFLLFGVAALFPGATIVGVLVLGAIAASAVALSSYAVLAYGVPMQMGEPWITVIYAGIAVAILYLRAHAKKETRRVERARAEALALARMARVVLLVRDRSNTPVQTLELGLRILSERAPPRDHELLLLLRRSTDRLRELSRLLPAVDRTDLSWDDGDVDLTREIDAVLAALGDVSSRDTAARGS